MFKNKMNAYGFMLITAVWVVFLLLSFSGNINIVQVSMYLFAIVAFLFFMIAKKENNGFAIVGLIISLVTALGSSLAGGFLGGATGIGIAYLFFAFSFIKSESTILNLLAWSMILVFLFTALFGFWNVPVLEKIFTGIASFLVGALFVYYLAGEAGINLPGNIDEKVKEKIG
jgi:hypothetical protein